MNIKKLPQEETISYNPATDNIGYWGSMISPNWYPRYFDIPILKLLFAAEQGKVSKILLSVPSRHGKSTLISKVFASYYLCKYPDDKIIISSYSQQLASEFGGAVKDIINSYGQETFNHPTISVDSKAKNRFHLASPFHGQMLAVGSNGSILGFGANLFIIDDPLKNVAEARSTTIQERLRNWFTGTAKTRLEKRPNGLPPIMVVIAQRLGSHDLHGIIKETEPIMNAKEAFERLDNNESIPDSVWVDLNLPAICTNPDEDILGRKEGEVLWKEQRDYEWLMSEKKAMGSYLFNCMYQGIPLERDGNIFKREWFYDPVTDKPNCLINPREVPEDLPLLRYWDFAASGNEGDETSGVLTGYDGEYMYILGLNNGKYTATQTYNEFVRTALRDGKHTQIYIEQEPGSASKILISRLQHSKQLKGYHIKADKVSTAKNVRSFDLEALAEDHRLKFVKNTWNDKMIQQLISFTGAEGGRDDIVDSLTGSAVRWMKPRRRIRA